jgi:hypothetical protein
MFGDYSVPYYKNVDFMFVNTLTAVFRGSMDKIDYDPTADRHKITTSGFARYVV